MTPHDDRRTDPALDRQLRELLRDAVDRIEPDERLGELRARVSRPSRRPALVALAGSVLAGAAVVTAVAVAGPRLMGPDQPDVADTPVASSPTEESSEGPSQADENPSRLPVATRTVAGYYLGDTASGVRLYREFRSVEEADRGPAESVDLLTTAPLDPDYRTQWPDGAFAGARIGDDRITVELADTSLEQRPDSMTEEEAQASVQQVVYTLQAYAQQRLPVEFTTAEGPAEQVLGTDSGEPVPSRTPTEVLSLVNLSDPAEGQAVTGRIAVRGVASSFEANVLWSLEDSSGESVADGYFTAEGWMDEQLHPFSDTVDVSSLEPGTYTLVVESDDPSGGTEGLGTFTDDRTVVVE